MLSTSGRTQRVRTLVHLGRVPGLEPETTALDSITEAAVPAAGLLLALTKSWLRPSPYAVASIRAPHAPDGRPARAHAPAGAASAEALALLLR